MIKCPICGKYEFKQNGDFGVCSICGWENDNIQFNDHDYSGGANWLSVNQARSNYKKYGKIMTDKDEKEYREFWENFNRKLKQKLKQKQKEG